MGTSTAIAGLSALLALSLSGPAISRDTDPSTQERSTVSYDGLHRIEKSILDEAYVKPDLDLSGYSRVMIDPVSVSYKRKPMRSSQRRASTSTGNFALTDRQMEELEGLFQDAFSEAMSRGEGWEVVESVGPDVLRVRARLIDLVVKVPTTPSTGRTTYFVREIGEVTLVLEILDSQSGEILARAVDRRQIGPGGAGPQRAVEVTARSDVRRLFDAWAAVLRAGLDQVRGLPAAANG